MPKKIVCQSELFIGFHPRIFILRLFLTKKKEVYISWKEKNSSPGQDSTSTTRVVANPRPLLSTLCLSRAPDVREGKLLPFPGTMETNQIIHKNH